MVKGLKGTRQNLNCNMVIKLTMGLRLNFLKPLMLKIPTESNAGWIHLFLKKGNFLHYFILRKCKIQTTAAIWKKVIMSVPAAICGEHEQESTWWPDQFLKVGGQKYINLLCMYCEMLQIPKHRLVSPGAISCGAPGTSWVVSSLSPALLFLPFFKAEFVVLNHSWKVLPRSTIIDFYTKGLEEGNMSKRENSKEHTGNRHPTETLGFEICRSTEIRLNMYYWMKWKGESSEFTNISVPIMPSGK